MQTRSPSRSDHEALVRLIDPPQANPFRPEEVSCALELLAAVLDPPEGNTYEARVLVDGADRPIAYGCFGLTPMTDATYDLYWLVTSAEHRGQGLGSALLAGIERELQGRGGRTVRIETSSLEGQGGARRFYLRAGYQEVGLIPDFYRPGDDLVTLAKRLGA
jgi:ribosomal protein S18 acetylase RimI-like enzyme